MNSRLAGNPDRPLFDTAPSRRYDSEAAEVLAGRMHTDGGPGGFAAEAEAAVQAVDPAYGSAWSEFE